MTMIKELDLILLYLGLDYRDVNQNSNNIESLQPHLTLMFWGVLTSRLKIMTKHPKVAFTTVQTDLLARSSFGP